MAYKVDENPVSKPWHVVLTHARRTGVDFLVTDGRRTLALQAKRYAHYLRYGQPLAARPWVGAPHINYGRANHAIDVNSLDGGAERLVAFLHRKGARSACRPIAGEPWHIQISRSDLLRLARSIEAKRRASR